jgi:NAD(P)-dependent dehydrogenase (short-subunit alcohol dehydrogenase family)
MLAQGHGKIINMASMATLLVPHPQKQIAYNASKAAVVKITQTLGCEWADRGVTVNCMSPGIVNTALIQVSPCYLLRIGHSGVSLYDGSAPKRVLPLLCSCWIVWKLDANLAYVCPSLQESRGQRSDSH